MKRQIDATCFDEYSSSKRESDLLMIEEIFLDGEVCAIILFASFDVPGIHFFTPPNLAQQIGSMSYSAGWIIPAHKNNPLRREIFLTQEALFIRRGKVRVDFYTDKGEYRKSRVLSSGDVILLIRGGHGFEVLEDLNMVEVKQGPYPGDADKTLFVPELPAKLNFK
jgi:hypothetical protein